MNDEVYNKSLVSKKTQEYQCNSTAITLSRRYLP